MGKFLKFYNVIHIVVDGKKQKNVTVLMLIT